MIPKNTVDIIIETAHVEEVVGEEEDGEVGGAPPRQRPVEEEEGREKEKVGRAGEEHSTGGRGQKNRATDCPGKGRPPPASSG